MSHLPNSGFLPGNRWAVCDRCGFDRRLSDVATEWTGLVVCRDTCLDVRNPQELRRDTIKNEGKVEGPVRSPPTTDTFTDVTYADDGIGDTPSGTFDNAL